MKQKLAFILIISIVFVGACRQTTTRTKAFNESVYKRELETWQSGRLATLAKEDGWLTLAGLFWLNEGENKFGSAPKNPIVLPKDKAPIVAGSLWLEQGRVRLTARPEAKIFLAPRPDAEVKSDNTPVTAVDLKDDTDEGGPTILKLGSLLINIVKRGERIGVRIKDTESAARLQFKGLEYYPIDPKWQIEARFERYQPPKTIPITNVLSMTDNEVSPGALAFEVAGKTYRIDPIVEKGETDLFVMIADGTTGGETYGAGRYLYVAPPDATGRVVIDFNKAYSPPCAFTNYATCPLPPRQNHLPFRIEAGEKKYAGTIH